MDMEGFDWLKERERLTPNKVAIIDVDRGQKFTYKDYNRRVEAMASFLWNEGVRKGDRIAILSPNDMAHFDLIFASAKIGSVFVPLNTRFSVKDIDYLLADSKPKLLFVHPSLLSLISQLETPKTIVLDEGDMDRSEYDVQFPSYRFAIQFPLEDYSTPYLTTNDPWIIIYTGGTTGFPKGAVLSYRSVIWNSLNTIVSWGIKESDVTVTYLPLFHTGGINALSMPILHMGGTVVIGNSFDPSEAVKVIEDYKCTIILLVPTMYHMLIKTKEFQEAAFKSMEVFLSGGAPCPISIYHAFKEKNLKFKEGYGLTEAGPNNFYIDASEAYDKRSSVGKPMFYNQVKIVDSKGDDVAPGEVGEVWLAGPHLFMEYWNKERETDEAFHHEWFKTGDLGKQDDSGYYYIVGRKKEMIISGGENIYPLEIETLLQQHKKIDEAVVVGLPNDKWGEIVAAFIVSNDSAIETQELKDYLAKQIAKYKIPKKFFFLKELPKTAVGKISKMALIHQYKEID